MPKNDFLELPDDSVAEIVSAFEDALPRNLEKQVENRQFLAACTLVAEANQIKIGDVASLPQDVEDIELLEAITNHANFRYRQVAIAGDWWRWDHGPLLVFKALDHQACALVPDSRGRYRLVDPSDPEAVKPMPLTRKTAALLDSYAYAFYRALPDRRLSWRDLLSFGLEGLRYDVKRLLFVLVVSSLLGLILPVSIGLIFDHVIPNANFDLLTQFVVALAVTSLSISIFYTAERIAATRLELRMNATVQAAVWDRLLRLPVSFFKEYSAGDLSDRASGIDEIQQTMTGNLVTNMLAGIFSVLSLALMFYYEFRLALGAVLLALLFAGINIAATVRQLPYQREKQQLEGENLGFLLQVLTGITKLRVSNKGSTAFRLWLGKFIHTTRLFMRTEKIRIRVFVFGSIYSVVVTASLFGMVIVLGKDLTLGSFMAFNALYGQFFTSMIAISWVVSSSLEIIPLYERAKPILDTLPETTSTGSWIGDLSGEIKIDRLSFRYPGGKTSEQRSKSPLLFENLDIKIAAGEFVALTGPSGCGKSTLFRLLLGLERPLSGSIHYDGTNLMDVNVRSLRNRIGVVLQNSTLMPGTILENILYGRQDLSEEYAWTAAQFACIDKEIESLPMGMHTYLSEAGRNFSGGQRQRILIARAFAKAPKILLLDEATSAMDNDTQSGIIEHIVESSITCIVSAHRLSTVRAADRILVLDKGSIVQEGSFNELAGKPGLFSQMARRQFL